MKRKLLTLCLAALMLCAGCLPALAAEDTLSVVVPLFAPEAPQKGAPVWEALNELTGLDLDLQFTPSDAVTDKLNISMASNTMPDVVFVNNIKSSSFVNAVRSGMFWDLTDIVKENPGFQLAYSDAVLYNTSLDGRNFVLPRTRISTRSGLILRKDWLEQVGMEVPTTLDELYAVLKAFSQEDFDGDGKLNTIPLVEAYNDGGIQGLGVMAIYAGLDASWTRTDEGFVPVNTTQAFMDRVLDFYRRLYEEGLMNQDFATIKQQQIYEIINAEMGGAYSDATDTIRTRFEPVLTAKKKMDDSLTLGDLFAYTQTMVTPEGATVASGGSGYNGGFAFPKSSLKTEEDLWRALNAILAIDSPEGQNLTKWGVDGVTFEYVDGVPSILNQDTYTVDVQVYSHLGISYSTNPQYTPGIVSDFERIQTQYQIDCNEYAMNNPMEPFSSETEALRGAELGKIVLDAQVKYIMGIIDADGYWSAVDQYLKSGGQQIVDEYNEAYNQANAQ